MKYLLFICFALFSILPAAAQNERYVKPVDEAAQDTSFVAFRAELIEAVRKHDTKFLLSIVDRDIKNGFGGEDGLVNFKKAWKIDRPDSKFWDEFLKVITHGGSFFNDPESRTRIFFAPYSFQSFPEDLDAFEHSVIFGNNVNLRAKPDPKSTVIAQLSYNVVKVDFEKSIKKPGRRDEFSWLRVETLGGRKGFVKAEFVRSPIDYRAGFEKIDGRWKLTVFLAGD